MRRPLFALLAILATACTTAAQSADNRRRATRPRRLDGLVRCLGIPDRFESFINAATSQLKDRLHWILPAGVDRMRGAEVSCRLQLVVHNIDGDERIRAEAFEELHAVETYAAAADHQGGIPRLETPAVLHRIVRGRHTTTDNARFFHGHAVGNFESHVRRNGDVLREAADVPTGDIRTVGISQRRRRRAVFAEIFPSRPAVAAMAASVAHADDDAIARPKIAARRSHLLDSARYLVS